MARDKTPTQGGSVQLERVILQLGWKHQFEFAGYYAAHAKGFYADAGLEVTLLEGGAGKSCYAIMMAGQADYCADDGDNIVHFVTGTPIVALAAFFQHSPVTLITRKGSGLESPEDLIGKRVETMHGGVHIPEIAAMFQREGISLDRLNNMEDSFGVGALIEGEVDAMFGFVSNEPEQLEQAGVEYHLIRPRSYGIDFYGDALFTTRRELEDHPERAEAFRAASIKGWEYAIGHQEEIVDFILANHNPQLSREHLLHEAKAIESLMKAELVEVGHMNRARWRQMADLMVDQGRDMDDFSIKGFVYDPDYSPDYTRAIMILAGVIVVGGAGITVLVFFNARLAREVNDRKQAEKRLEAANRELEKLSVTDGLTNLTNRRRFDETLTAECARSSRGHHPLALAMIDIDYFKTYNDHYGHQTGDGCLKKVAHVLSATARRAGDLAARYGGEEFVLIMADTEASNAMQLVDGLRGAIEQLAIPHAGSPFGTVTISVGVAVVEPDTECSAEELVALADGALYGAKHNGRNRVEMTTKSSKVDIQIVRGTSRMRGRLSFGA